MTTGVNTRRSLGDVKVGEVIEGRRLTIGEHHVATFAGLTGDFYPLHVDEQYAATTKFGARIAHGLLTFVVGAGAIADAMRTWDVIAALGFGNTSFVAPVFFGDTITPTAVVSSIDPGERSGKVSLSLRLLNQRNDAVLESVLHVLVRR